MLKPQGKYQKFSVFPKTILSALQKYKIVIPFIVSFAGATQAYADNDTTTIKKGGNIWNAVKSACPHDKNTQIAQTIQEVTPNDTDTNNDGIPGDQVNIGDKLSNDIQCKNNQNTLPLNSKPEGPNYHIGFQGDMGTISDLLISGGYVRNISDTTQINTDIILGKKTQQAIGSITTQNETNKFTLSSSYLNTQVPVNFYGQNVTPSIKQFAIGVKANHLFGSSLQHGITGKIFHIISDDKNLGTIGEHHVGIQGAQSTGLGVDTIWKLGKNVRLDSGISVEHVEYKNDYTDDSSDRSVYGNIGLTIQPRNDNQFSIGINGNESSYGLSAKYKKFFSSKFSLQTSIENINYTDPHIQDQLKLAFGLQYNFGSGTANSLNGLFNRENNNTHINEVNAHTIRNLNTYTKKVENILVVIPGPTYPITPEDPTNPILTAKVANVSCGDTYTSNNIITCNWDALTGMTIVGYEISLDGGSTWQNIGNVTTYTTNALSDGSYEVQIKAYNDSGTSNSSDEINITVDTLIPTSASFDGLTPSTQNTTYNNLSLSLDNKIIGGTITSATTNKGGSISNVSVDSFGNIKIGSYKTPSANSEIITVNGKTKAGADFTITVRSLFTS